MGKNGTKTDMLIWFIFFLVYAHTFICYKRYFGLQ